MSQLTKKEIVIIILTIIVIAGFVIWQISKKQIPPGEIKQPGLVTALPEIVPISAKEGEIPEGFPATIPLNEKMNIVESYSLKNRTTGEITGATVVFQSSRTLKENQTFYEKWAKDNKWQVITTNVDTDDINKNIIHLALSKDNTYLNISLEELLYNTTKVMIVYRPMVDSDANKLREQLKNIKL